MALQNMSRDLTEAQELVLKIIQRASQIHDVSFNSFEIVHHMFSIIRISQHLRITVSVCKYNKYNRNTKHLNIRIFNYYYGFLFYERI